MPFESGLLVSLPASELPNIELTASLFGRPVLYGAQLSDLLQEAIGSLEAAKAPLLFVARPEMFADGATLEWLTARCGGVVDHLNISDGLTVKLLPGFRNHVFFYGLGRREDHEALGRLEGRLPEIFSQVHCQVNTALSFRWKDKFIQPQTLVMNGRSGGDAPDCKLRRLFLNRYSPDDSADRTLSFALVEPPASRFRELHYIRLTERGLRNADCARDIADLAARIFVDPTKCAIFVTPRGTASPRDRLRALAAGLVDGGVHLPGATVPNILTAPEDLPAEALRAMSDVRHLIVDDADDFWRRPACFYETFESVTVYTRCQRHDPVAFQRMLNHAYGARTLIAWSSDRSRPRL
jgi:hypothetical protein